MQHGEKKMNEVEGWGIKWKESETGNKGSGDHIIFNWINNDWKFTKTNDKVTLKKHNEYQAG